MPLLLTALLNQRWILGRALCCTYTVVISASINTSIMTLCLVSVDRLMAVIKPFEYRAQDTVTQRWTRALIIGGWVHSFFWAVTPIVGWGEIVSEPNTHTCKPNWSAVSLKNRSYSFGLGLFCFVAPVITTIVVYAIIYIRSIPNKKWMEKVMSIQTEVRQKQQKAVLITVLIIIGVFCCCWLLYTIVTFWKFFSNQAPPNWLVQLGLMFALFNSCANPVIYAVRDKKLRASFLQLFNSCLGNKKGIYTGNFTSTRKYSNCERLYTSCTQLNNIGQTDLRNSKSTLNMVKDGILGGMSSSKASLSVIRDETEMQLFSFDFTGNNVEQSPETSL